MAESRTGNVALPPVISIGRTSTQDVADVLALNPCCLNMIGMDLILAAILVFSWALGTVARSQNCLCV